MGDSNIRKAFFGDPRRERLGCAIRNGVDTQVAERASSGLEGDAPQRGLADVCGRLLQGAPYAKRKRLQKSFGFYRQRAEASLRHSRHWLSTDQRRYAAADAWARLLKRRGAKSAWRDAVRSAKARGVAVFAANTYQVPGVSLA